MADETKDYSYAADLLFNELRRTWPEEMPKDELLRTSGLETEEARAGLALLETEGRLDPDADQLKAKVDEEEPMAPPEPEGDGEPETAEGEVEKVAAPSTTAPLATGAGPTYHAKFDLSISYSGSPGQSEESAVAAARAMEAEIADRIHAMYAGAVIGIELQAIQVYDKPREISLTNEEDEDGTE